jgi:hypothetical protein
VLKQSQFPSSASAQSRDSRGGVAHFDIRREYSCTANPPLLHTHTESIMQSGILGSSKGETELPVKSDNAETRASACTLHFNVKARNNPLCIAKDEFSRRGVHLLYFKWKCRRLLTERKVGLCCICNLVQMSSAQKNSLIAH